MNNSFSKCCNKTFTLHTPAPDSGHLKSASIDLQKNYLKYFVTVIYRNHGYEIFPQIMKSVLINVYDRFPPQSFKL